MLKLNSRSRIAEELEKTNREIERLSAHASGLRKQLALSERHPEVREILERQPLGPTLLNGLPATPEEVLKERLNTDLVSLQQATEITDKYRSLLIALNVQEHNIKLAVYGAESTSAQQVMRKLYASEVLQKLLQYRSHDIGRFVSIDSNGYISIIH